MLLAQETGRLDTVGIDLVAMSVNDVLTIGARPVLFLDYVAVGRLGRRRWPRWWPGWPRAAGRPAAPSSGARWRRCPGSTTPGEFDLAGFCVGLGERTQADRRVGGRGGRRRHRSGVERRPLQRLLAGAQGAGGRASCRLGDTFPQFAETIARHVCSSPPASTCGACWGCWSGRAGQGMAHITGGGIAGNLSRVIPDGLSARLDFRRVAVPPVFRALQRPGRHLRRGDVPGLQHGRRLRAGAAAEPAASACASSC